MNQNILQHRFLRCLCHYHEYTNNQVLILFFRFDKPEFILYKAKLVVATKEEDIIIKSFFITVCSI